MLTQLFLGSVEFSAHNISQFYFPLVDIEPDVVRFVTRSRQHLIDFHKDHEKFQIELIADPEKSAYNIKVKPLLTSVSYK